MVPERYKPARSRKSDSATELLDGISAGDASFFF